VLCCVVSDTRYLWSKVLVRSNSIDLNKRELIYGINRSWMKITTLLLLIEISFSSSLHESVASLNLPSSSCFLILWAILISKMGLLDKRENEHSIDYILILFCSKFSNWEDGKHIYLFDFSNPLSSSLETSLRRGPHDNWKFRSSMKYVKIQKVLNCRHTNGIATTITDTFVCILLQYKGSQRNHKCNLKQLFQKINLLV